jgi:hypothetical protein
MRRKGSFLTRFFTNPSGPMKKPNGDPTRLALSAAAWGEPVPQNMQDAAELAAKGRRLLERYQNTKEKSVHVEMEKEGEVTSSGMGSGIKNPTQGNRYITPTIPKKKKEKKEMSSYKIEELVEIIKTQDETLQNDVNYDMVLSMNEQEINRLSLLKRLVNWLVPDVQENASTQVEVTENTQEEEMDIAILKEALGAVVDEKLDTFATSIKEEIEASVQEKIDTITKGFEANTVELQEKLEAAEKALAETEEQVSKFADAGAIKKSVDPEEEEEEGDELAKSDSIWGNMYLPQSVISALGYKS